jgi:hypothetical protein
VGSAVTTVGQSGNTPTSFNFGEIEIQAGNTVGFGFTMTGAGHRYTGSSTNPNPVTFYSDGTVSLDAQGANNVAFSASSPVLDPRVVNTNIRYRPCDKKKDKKKSECFSSSNTVEVQGEGFITMDSLKIGDYVRAGKNKFSRVYSFLHLDRDVEIEFLQIHAEGLKTPLEVSSDHMVFVNNAPLRASQVKVGDMLGNNKVADIKFAKRRGVYAPVTESGDIVVSGALASSYAAVRSFTPINQHTEAHAFFSIRRLICNFNFDVCKNETYTEDGFPQWLAPIIDFTLTTNASAHFFASVVGLPIIAAAYAFEQSFHYPFIIGMVIIVGLFGFKKNKSSKIKIL